MKVIDALIIKKEDIEKIAAKYGAQNIRVFGSVARESESKDSDIDFLITLDENRSLLDRIGLIQELEELLLRKVDVVTEKSLHWYIKDKVLKEAIKI